MQYYIYVAKQYGVIKYIGKGQNGRYKHITSGTSHCYEANKAHFLEPNTVEVTIEAYFDSEEECLEVEELMILTVKPEWNKEFISCGKNRLQGEDVDLIRSVPPKDRLTKEHIKLTLISYPDIHPTTYLIKAGIVQSAENNLKVKNIYSELFEEGYVTVDTYNSYAGIKRKQDEGKANIRANKRLQTVISILEMKNKKEKKMPEILKSFQISSATFARYREEFRSELKEMKLIK